MKLLNIRKVLDINIILAFIMIPYIFTTISEVNFTMFDLLLIILGLNILTFKRGHSILIKNMKIYLPACIFMSIAIIPLNSIPNKISYIIVLLQYTFIFFWMFPIILEVLDIRIYKVAISYMCRIWGLFLIYNLLSIGNQEMYMARRFAGYYSNPGTFGVMISIIAPILIENITLEERKIFKLLSSLGVLASGILLMASGSRAGILGLFCGIVLYLVLKYGISLRVFRKSIIAIIIIVIILSFSVDRFERNAFSRLFKYENIQNRTQDYKIATEVIDKNILIGTGLQYSNYIIKELGGRNRPHNIFIAYLTEVGLIGLLAITSIILSSVFGFWKLLYYNFSKSHVVDGLFACTISSGVILFITSQFSTPTVHRGLWVFWALSFWASREANNMVKCKGFIIE